MQKASNQMSLYETWKMKTVFKLTALDSNMTLISPEITGQSCKLMTTALLPVSGNSWETKKRYEWRKDWQTLTNIYRQRINRYVALCFQLYLPYICPAWHTHTGTPAPSSQWFLPTGHCHCLCPHLQWRHSRPQAGVTPPDEDMEDHRRELQPRICSTSDVFRWQRWTIFFYNTTLHASLLYSGSDSTIALST